MPYLAPNAKPVTLTTLQTMKQQGERFSCLTCYDATFAHAMAEAGIEVILVGDSLGMVVQGKPSTVPVTVADMVYHTQNVAYANRQALIMTDLPFMSYATLDDAIKSSSAVMQAGANVVKIEGGARLAPIIKVLADNGVPTCAHLGLTPQTVNVLGGYKVQGKSTEAAKRLLDDCEVLAEAGAALLLLECVPAALAKTVRERFSLPVIGIGAGVDCDGQILVMHDMLGIHTQKPAKFVKDFLGGNPNGVVGAFRAYHEAVKQGHFPTTAHSFG